MYLQVIWKEPRLIAPDEISQSGAMDQKFLNLLWIPDIQIYNLKDFNKRLDEWVSHDRLDLSRVEFPQNVSKKLSKNYKLVNRFFT